MSNNLDGKTEIIDKYEYEKVKLITEQNLIKKYPEIFKLKDSCYNFTANQNNGIGIKTAELKACKNKVHTTHKKMLIKHDCEPAHIDLVKS